MLTAPFEVRRVMALRADALSACNRIFVEEIARSGKESAGVGGAETGSVTFVQRFNATLGCFVHFHVVAPDGVFSRAEDGAVNARRVTAHAMRVYMSFFENDVTRRVWPMSDHVKAWGACSLRRTSILWPTRWSRRCKVATSF